MEIPRDEILEHLRTMLQTAARSGFDSEDWVVEWVGDHIADELRNDPEDLRTTTTDQLLAELREALKDQHERETTWKELTMNDRIDRAFEELETQGVVALQNAGYTMSDGWEDVHDARARVADAWGATFFHGQDVERGVGGHGLMLAFGAFVSGDGHEPESLRLGRLISDVLKKHDVPTEWDGTLQHRIFILPFEWQKRRTTQAPSS